MIAPRTLTNPLAACWLLALIAGCATPYRGAAGPKIYILTDLEGASGVYRFAQTRDPETELTEQAREYFMGDLAAVVRGLRDAGASEILVLDGHGSGAVLPDLMVSGAKYVVGSHREKLLWGLDESFDGLVMLGCHAMMGTPDGVLNHTQSSRSENRYWYNGVESGELAQVAAMAGHYSVPPIMVTGDEATCREARQFFGPDCVTVAVKKGINREAAVLYPFAETRRALYRGAKQAVAAIPRCKPYTLKTPIQAQKQWRILDAAGNPGQLETKEGTITDVTRLLDF
jgi:D-amino peptidase